MISIICGNVVSIDEQNITILAPGGLGFSCNTPRPHLFKEGESVKLHIYLHWNSDQGPSLYAFQTELERQTFILIISCPQIGPKIGLACLASSSASQLLNAIASQDHALLAQAHGVSEKKAHGIISHLQGKVEKLVLQGSLPLEAQTGIDWNSLNEALSSLGYKKHEIAQATQYLSGLVKDGPLPFDSLLRKALAHLSAKQ